MLSKQFALDDQTIAEIKSFVADGGAVIADVLPGQYDQYCRVRKTSAMQDLFGVSHEKGYDFTPTRLHEHLGNCQLDYKTIIDKGTGTNTSQCVQIKLPKKSIVYTSQRENIQSNSVNTFLAELPPGRARFWAVSNTEIKFDIAKTSSIQMGQPAVYTITAEPTDTTMPFYVYLQSPDGVVPDWSRKVLLTDNGKAEYIFTPPFNIDLNQWTVHVKSGFTGEVKKETIGE